MANLYISWNPNSSINTVSQTVQYKKRVSTAWITAGVVLSNTNNYIINGVDPNTLYDIRIISTCSVGGDTSSNITSAIKLYCPTVTLTVDNNTYNLNYSFASLVGEVTSYTIDLLSNTDVLLDSQTKFQGGTITGSFLSLNPSTTYKVRVKTNVQELSKTCPSTPITTPEGIEMYPFRWIVDETQSYCEPTPDCTTGIDMVFVIDRTSSMGQALENVKNSLDVYVDAVKDKSNNNYRLGLVSFSDPDIRKELDFSLANETAFQTAVNGIILDGQPGSNGSGDTNYNVPEPSDIAMSYIIEQPNNYVGQFRTDVVKIITLITDATPSGGDDNYGPEDLARVQELANLASNKGIIIFSIAVGYNVQDPDLIQVMKVWSDTTGGVFVQRYLGDASTGIVNALNQICGTGGIID